MPRDFESGSSQRFTTNATSWGTGVTTFTVAGAGTVESIPGAGVNQYITMLSSGTGARQAGILLRGDSSGSLALQTGTTAQVPGTLMIPPTGVWCIFAATKSAGTTTPRFYMYRKDTNAWTVFDGAGTLGDRTVNLCNVNAGSRGNADYWDGTLDLVGLWNGVVFTDEQVYSLIYRRSWFNYHKDALGYVIPVDNITSSTTDPYDLFRLDNPLSAGTDPTVATNLNGPW